MKFLLLQVGWFIQMAKSNLTHRMQTTDMIVVPVMDARINEKIKAATKGKN